MSYTEIKNELEQAIDRIGKDASIYSGEDGGADIYAQGLEDAITYLDCLVLMVNELVQNEQYEAIRNRETTISDRQMKMF